MADPAAPDLATRDQLLVVLAELIARGGVDRFLVEPVVPGAGAFPEPWAATRSGVELLLRRLAAHAGFDRAIAIDDRRAGPPPTERKPATRIELVSVDRREALFALGFVGSDDVVGTLAHELGVAHAVLVRPDRAEPYRSQAVDVLEVEDGDATRGSIATVYLGLGVLAANAAYQRYAWGGRFNGAYEPLEFEVLHAGHLEMPALAYLLAVQAVVRGDSTPPPGLESPQRDEVAAWVRALRDERAALCERLGVSAAARGTARAPVSPFADARLEPEPEHTRKTAFRWRTNRGGVGLLAGTVFGASLAMLVATRGVVPLFAFGGAAGGHLVGRRVPVPRCSACASVVPAGATQCPHCGALLRGDIAHLGDRLEAEEQLSERLADRADSPP